MALTLDGTTGISATGNIYGNNITVPGTLSVGTFTTSTFSASGNIVGSNILTAGFVSATGNIAGAYVLGNGSQLTGLPEQYGNANVANYLSSGTVTANILTTGLISSTGNLTGGNINTAGQVTATNNITGGNLLTGGLISATSTITSSANITGGNLLTGGSVSATANITGGNIFTGGDISAAGNVTAKNLNSSNADLAEMYVADTDYLPGTVVEFGGQYEITATTQSHSTRVAGVISTAPSYLMNATQTGNHVLPVALTGRVPCQVVGVIHKGDRLVASSIKGTAEAMDPAKYQPACIIGKALQNYSSDQVGIIEIAVGKN